MTTPIINPLTLSKEQRKKYNKCHYYGKGGWCGLLHEKEVTLTKKGKAIRIICVRCSEIVRRNGECKHFRQSINAMDPPHSLTARLLLPTLSNQCVCFHSCGMECSKENQYPRVV